ncbi:MAG: hypothetical protein GDA37_03060 [Ekhidna sp.]|nr:hypothetical protein [Ekhidna sp.]
MKRVLNLFMVLVFASPLVFTSCGKDDGGDGPEQTKAEEFAPILEGTWTVDDSDQQKGVKIGGGFETKKFSDSNFQLIFSNTTKDGGNYKVTGEPNNVNSKMWGEGTWKFDNENAKIIVRNDDKVSMDLTLKPEGIRLGSDNTIVYTMTLVFTIPAADTQSRLSGVSGEECIFHLKRPIN